MMSKADAEVPGRIGCTRYREDDPAKTRISVASQLCAKPISLRARMLER